jgi:hypothetical protein
MKKLVNADRSTTPRMRRVAVNLYAFLTSAFGVKWSVSRAPDDFCREKEPREVPIGKEAMWAPKDPAA